MNQIVIKKGNDFELKLDKKQLKTIKSTPDGIVFSFKNGIDFYNVDERLPRHTKELIESSLNIMDKNNADVEYDLINYNQPFSIKM